MEYGKSSSLAKLEALRGSMADMSQEMERETRRRRDHAAGLLQEAGDEVMLMEQAVAVEARRRIETENALEQYAHNVLDTAASTVSKQLCVRLDILESNAAQVESKLSSLETDLSKQRAKDEKLVVDLQRLTAQLTARVHEEVEEERASRLEFEASLVQQMRHKMITFQERMQLEAQTREHTGASLVDAVRATAKWSERAADDKVKAQMVADTDDLKGHLANLRAQRYESEGNLEDIMEQLVHEVNTAVRSAKNRR
jgi:hypothetical protein